MLKLPVTQRTQTRLFKYTIIKLTTSYWYYNSFYKIYIFVVISGGPLTIFAPLDAAFYALPAGYLNDVFLNVTHSKGQSLFNYT